MKTTVKQTWLDRQVGHFEETPFAAMALIITAQSCWGSIAAAMAVSSTHVFSNVLLMFCAVSTIVTNAVCISQSPARWCIITTLISVSINALIIATLLIL